MIDDHPLNVHRFASIQTLTTLDLRGKQLGKEGTKFLANALQTNTVRELLYSSITGSPSSFNTDTHNVESWMEGHQR